MSDLHDAIASGKVKLVRGREPCMTRDRSMSAPDLSSLTEEQRSAVAYMAQREAAALIRRALEGADQRIADAIASGTVQLPIFHLDEIARIEANWSTGNTSTLSVMGEERVRELAREEIDSAFPEGLEEELTPP